MKNKNTGKAISMSKMVKKAIQKRNLSNLVNKYRIRNQNSSTSDHATAAPIKYYINRKDNQMLMNPQKDLSNFKNLLSKKLPLRSNFSTIKVEESLLKFLITFYKAQFTTHP